MNYYSRCLHCKRKRRITSSTLYRFLDKDQKVELEKRIRGPSSKEIEYVLIEFHGGCPECSGQKGRSFVQLKVGKKKKLINH